MAPAQIRLGRICDPLVRLTTHIGDGTMDGLRVDLWAGGRNFGSKIESK